jgi:hypothetical protein
MKYLLLSFCLLPAVLWGQDCNLKKGQDPITSKPTLTTGFIDISQGTLTIDVNSKEIDFFFDFTNPIVKCLDEETEATMVLEGGKTKIQFHNSGSMNCDGVFHIIFRNSAYTPSQVQKMASRKIVSMQLTGPNITKPFIITFPPDQQQYLLNTIGCVARDAKTVL